jgi:hypothetical protein
LISNQKIIMKIKAACCILLVMSAVVWATWSFAYKRGYSQGSRDEFYCWKQVPMSDYDHNLITAQREMWLLPGGKRLSPRFRLRDTGAKNDITFFSISR